MTQTVKKRGSLVSVGDLLLKGDKDSLQQASDVLEDWVRDQISDPHIYIFMWRLFGALLEQLRVSQDGFGQCLSRFGDKALGEILVHLERARHGTFIALYGGNSEEVMNLVSSVNYEVLLGALSEYSKSR